MKVNKDSDSKNDNEEGHSNDKVKATEDRLGRNTIENTLIETLKNKDMLLNEKDKHLQDKDELLENQNELLKSHEKHLKNYDNLLKVSDKLIESQDKLLESQNRLLKDKDKLLEKDSMGAGGVEEAIVQKSTLQREKAKHIDNAEGDSEVDRIESLEKRIKFLEAFVKTVLNNFAGDEIENTKNETLIETLIETLTRFSANG